MQGAAGQSAPLQEWQNSSGTPLSVVNNCGWLGIGNASPKNTLSVNGSFGIQKVEFPTKNYTVQETDFAVVANTAITVTMPKASTVPRMIVVVKNNSSGTVRIAPASGDVIDGSSTGTSLAAKYNAAELLSNGYSQWFVIGKV